jgi:hypothetical protein
LGGRDGKIHIQLNKANFSQKFLKIFQTFKNSNHKRTEKNNKNEKVNENLHIRFGIIPKKRIKRVQY